MKQTLDIMAKLRSQNIELIEKVANTNVPASKPRRLIMMLLVYSEFGIPQEVSSAEFQFALDCLDTQCSVIASIALLMPKGLEFQFSIRRHPLLFYRSSVTYEVAKTIFIRQCFRIVYQ